MSTHTNTHTHEDLHTRTNAQKNTRRHARLVSWRMWRQLCRSLKQPSEGCCVNDRYTHLNTLMYQYADTWILIHIHIHISVTISTTYKDTPHAETGHTCMYAYKRISISPHRMTGTVKRMNWTRTCEGILAG